MSLRKILAERRIFSKARRGIKRFVAKVGWEISTDDLCFPGRPLNKFYLHPRLDSRGEIGELPEHQIIVEVSFEDNEIRIRPPFSLKEEQYVIPFAVFEEEPLVQKLEEFYKRTTSPEAEVRKSEENPQEIWNTLSLGWYYSERKQELQLARIAEKDRATHLYVVGATGTGKTKFLEFLILQDIKKGNGFGVIDPHGDLVEEIKGFLTYSLSEEELSEKVVLIDPTAPNFTVTFNPLEKLENISPAQKAGELISALKKIWASSWGTRMEDLLRNSLIALAEAGLALVDLPRFLTRSDFRERVLIRASNPTVQEYFRRFGALTERGRITWVEPVMNKINALLSDERLRQIFSSPKSSFNLREIIDGRKILLVKLDKGRLKDASDLLGSLILAEIQLAAFSRTDIPQSKRIPFYLYIDEFQNFATESFASVLSEARKYGLSLTLAHQTLAQIPNELKGLILGNTGIQVYFRLNRQDAQLLAKEAFSYSGYEVKRASLHGPSFWSLAEEWEHYIEELQGLPPRYCYVKHKIEGGMIPLYTAEVEPAWQVLGMDEEEYLELLRSLPFGRRYLVAREEVAMPQPIKVAPELLPKKKTLKRPPIPSEILSQKPLATEKKALSQHRYLQSLIKKFAQEVGYKAVIERSLPDGLGRVDVSLERNGLKIACEISITTDEENELLNIEKCLKAGYEKVILCSPEKRKLNKIKALASERLDTLDREKVFFLQPEEILPFLKTQTTTLKTEEKRIKGYKVKVHYRPLKGEEEKMKKEAIAKVVIESLQRMRGKREVGN